MLVAAISLIALMAFMLAGSPLRAISPAALLAGVWASVYLLQCALASDMNCSPLAVATILAITLSFSVGELIGCGGLRKLGRAAAEERCSTRALARGRIEDVRGLKVITVAFTLFGALGMLDYANAIGFFSARSAADMLSMPGVARLAINSGQMVVPMSSRIGFLFAYSGVVLSLSYYYICRWRWWLVLSMLNVALLGASQAGRAGAMMVLVQASLVMYLKNSVVCRRNMLRSFLASMSIPSLLIFTVFITGELLREGFKSANLDDIGRILYSARGYLFGGLSAFSYWIDNLYDPRTLSLGKYSFSSLYSALGLIAVDSGIYQFYAPLAKNGDVSNVYTAYRSFIEDFSLPGACLIYCGAGIFIASVTRRVLKGQKVLILVLIPMLTWLALSPMFSATYFNSFLLSCVMPYLLVRKFVEVKDETRQVHLR